MTEAKQQFNVSLSADLVRRIKHRAIDYQLSLSDLVTRVFEDVLSGTSPAASQGTSLRLQPMVHVESVAASVAFLEQLGGEVIQGSRDGDWVLMRMAGTELSLLGHPPNPEQDEGTVELNFQAGEPLENLERRFRRAGVIIAQPTADEGFGRQLQIRSPDGLLIKINELEPELYT